VTSLRLICAAACIAAASILSAPAFAFEPSRSEIARTRFVGNLEVDHQFNAVATVTFTDGSTSSLGDALVGVNAGLAHPLTPDGMFEVQTVLGFLVSRINASNGSAIFWDFPLEVTGHVNVGPFRFGAGPALHISPMLRGDGFASGSNVTFATTVGGVVRAEYRLSQHWGVGFNYSWLRLSASGQSGDASRIGGSFGWYL
jgi:hypothetical protein